MVHLKLIYLTKAVIIHTSAILPKDIQRKAKTTQQIIATGCQFGPTRIGTCEEPIMPMNPAILPEKVQISPQMIPCKPISTCILEGSNTYEFTISLQ